MSSEGPVISMQPVSALSGNPMSKHLMSIPRRERSSSTSDVSSRSQQHLLPPSPLVDPTRQSLDIHRSLSMPRGVRGLSAEPNPTKSLPSSKSTDFRAAPLTSDDKESGDCWDQPFQQRRLWGSESNEFHS